MKPLTQIEPNQIASPLRRLVLFLALAAGTLAMPNQSFADHLTVTVANNDVRIEGDFLANVLTVSVFDSPGRRIQTCFIEYSGTITVRGTEASIDERRKLAIFEVGPYIDDIRIFTYGGHDTITVNRFDAKGSNGDVVLDSGDEFDEIFVSNVSARDIILKGGTGDDDLTATNCHASGWIAIRGQQGGNTISAVGCSATNMGLRGGEERDFISADFVSGGALYIFGYEGNDEIELGHYVASNNSLPTLNVDCLAIDTQDGNDKILAHYISALTMIIDTGDDNDTITLPILESDLLDIDTGGDDDIVTVNGMIGESADSSLLINTGWGDDSVELGFGPIPIDFNLHWMEVRLGTGDDSFYNYVNGFVGDYIWHGGSGIDKHYFFPGAGSWYADPWKTLGFE